MVRISDTSSYDNPDTAWLKKNNKMSSTAESVVQLKEPRRSKFCATCFVSRNPGYYIMNVYSFNCLITILTLTLFIIDVESADKRITGTFKLILTLFTFKIVTSKALPTISYLTSLDKYQMINITYLALCCLWHSIVTSLNVNEVYKNRADNSAFGALIVFFVTIQVVFTFGFFRSYQKIKKLEKEELQFLTECATNPNDLEEYDDED